nr:hypothetical protein GCM10020093_033920 [Planobispora longispora]
MRRTRHRAQPDAVRLLRAGGRRGRDDPRLAGLALRLVVFGGERLVTASLAPWFDRFGPDGPELVNMYGITETTVHVTAHRVGAAEDGEGSRIGRPLDDLGVVVLDCYGDPAPPGVAGRSTSAAGASPAVISAVPP